MNIVGLDNDKKLATSELFDIELSKTQDEINSRSEKNLLSLCNGYETLKSATYTPTTGIIVTCYRQRDNVVLRCVFDLNFKTNIDAWSSYKIMTLPTEFRPFATFDFVPITCDISELQSTALVYLGSDGALYLNCRGAAYSTPTYLRFNLQYAVAN